MVWNIKLNDSRRGFKIDSLAVGVTEDKTVSRMTIVVEGDAYTVEQLEKQLNKVVDEIGRAHV